MGVENPKEREKRVKKILEPLKSEETEVEGKQGVMIPITKRCQFRCRKLSSWIFADMEGNIVFLCEVHRGKYTNYGKRR